MAAPTSLERPTDAALVDGVVSGDQAAFTASYDRYADELFDLCFAILRDRDAAAVAVRDTFTAFALRLDELAEPSRLRQWLGAIAGGESLRRAGSRGWPPPDAEPAEPASEDSFTTRAEHARRALARELSGALTVRERALLGLQLRHAANDAELGLALGLRPGRVARLVRRTHDEASSTLGALLVARFARGECTKLDAALTDWDGEFTATTGKRLVRHVEGCPACGRSRRSVPDPLSLLTAAPQMHAPASLRPVVVRSVKAPPPAPHTPVRSSLQARPVAQSQPPTRSPLIRTPPTWTPMPPRPPLHPPPAPLRRGVVGRRVAAALVVLAIAAGGLVIWRGGEIAQWITTQTSHDTTRPAVESRAGTAEAVVPGIPSTGQTPAGAATSAGSSPTTSVAPEPGPPSVVRQSALPARIEIAGCPNDRATVHATVLADAPVKSVNLGWRPPGAAVQQVSMTRNGEGYSATLGPFTTPGVVVWAIEVIDSRGLAGYGPIANLQVGAC